MPPNQRLQAIIDYLADKPGPTPVSDLAGALSVSIRTVHADLSALKEHGIPVRASAGRTGGVWIDGPVNWSGYRWPYDVSLRTPPAHESRPREPFVGYKAQLAELTSSIEIALAGNGRILLVAGEAGIGKTRLLEEAALRFTAAGALALWGACPETDGAPPYWPWTQILRGLYRSRRDVLSGIEGVDWGLIALVAPEYADLAGGVVPPTPRSTAEERFRLFEMVSRLLRAASALSPTTIFLDDLHRADDASLALLEYVAAEITSSRLLAVGSVRAADRTAGAPLPRVLPMLAGYPHCRMLRLEGLEPPETSQLIEVLAPSAPSASLVGTVHDMTNGNPFFTQEIVRSLGERGFLRGEPAGERLPIPETVRGVIERRLQELSRVCLRVLNAAAVLGRELDHDRLRVVTREVDSTRRLRALDEAVKARVLDYEDATPRRYRFSHTVIHQVVYDSLPLDHRIEAHAEAALGLEALYGQRVGEHAAELAHHFEQAQDLLGTEKYVFYATRAGEHAAASYAWEAAAGYFQRAMAARRYEPPDVLLGDLYADLGRTQAALLQPEAAVRSLNQAFDIYVALDETSKAAMVAAVPIPSLPGRFPEHVDLPARGLDLPNLGGVERVRLLVAYACALGLQTFEFDKAEVAADEALKAARSERDPELTAEALLARVHGSVLERLEFKALLPTCLEVVELRGRLRAPWMEAAARQWAGVAYACAGRPQDAQRQFDATVAVADRAADRHHGQLSLWFSGLALLWEGRWDEALRRGRLASGLHGMSLEAVMRAVVESKTGDLDRARDLSRRAMELNAFGRRQIWAASVLADVGRLTGDPQAVEETQRLALALLDYPRQSPASRLPAYAVLATAALAQGDSAAMARLYRELLPRAGDFSLCFFFLPGCLDRWLGLLACALGRRDDAAGHFEQAIAICRSAGYLPELAWSCYDYAAMLSPQRGAVPQEKARDYLEEAEQIARTFGMRPLGQRVEALEDELASRKRGRGAYPAGLTEREVEVLRLIALGRSNPQIADQLFVSAYTVADHVKNILIKTNTANRAEAAAYAIQHHLVGSSED